MSLRKRIAELEQTVGQLASRRNPLPQPIEISRVMLRHHRSGELLSIHYDLIRLKIEANIKPGEQRSHLMIDQPPVTRTREELEVAYQTISAEIMRDTFGEEITSRLVTS